MLAVFIVVEKNTLCFSTYFGFVMVAHFHVQFTESMRDVRRNYRSHSWRQTWNFLALAISFTRLSLTPQVPFLLQKH